MQLPEDDENYLNDQGFNWSLTPDGAAAGFLIIKDFDVAGGGFTPPKTDLLIRIPAQYNMAQLDMWYCDPPLVITATGQPAPACQCTEQFLGRNWQRFSRHLPPGTWKAGVDNLRTFMRHIHRELQGKG